MGDRPDERTRIATVYLPMDLGAWVRIGAAITKEFPDAVADYSDVTQVHIEIPAREVQ